jgi:Cu(I)/Ag(I) efflux system protein CusF
MRAAIFLTLLAAPLALAACDNREEADDTPDMPMATQDMPMTQGGEGGQVASAEGTVTAIDAEAGTITIDHSPVTGVDWPAMTMAFQADEARRQQVAVGDEVLFNFEMSEGGSKITSISKK